jgi:uncharacterized protein (DUF58 family)
MPTARGWVIATAAVGLWVAGRGFGTGALEQLGFGLLVLVLAAVFVVRRSRHELKVDRSVVPGRTQAGREVTVTLTLTNEGRGPAPLLLLEDHLPARLAGRARFALGGIEAGGHRNAQYKVRPARRGVYQIGPLEIGVSDPFGVARRSILSADASQFLVHPRIEPLTMPRDEGRRRVTLTSSRRQPTGATGEDFYTLREYQEGDDLRRIHWPATAKRGRYMIRQEETPWHARGTILLDDRAAPYDDYGWERAVEVAASIADLLHRAGHSFRLLGAFERGVAAGRGPEHFHRCLDTLAVASPVATVTPTDPLLVRLAELEAQPYAEGNLFIVTGIPEARDATAMAVAARRFRLATVVSVLRRQEGVAGNGSQVLFARAGIKHISLPPGSSLAAAWSVLWSSARGTVATKGGEQAWGAKRVRA